MAVSLDNAAEGEWAIIKCLNITNGKSGLLKKLGSLGIIKGRKIKVITKSGPTYLIRVDCSDNNYMIDNSIAKKIIVYENGKK